MQIHCWLFETNQLEVWLLNVDTILFIFLLAETIISGEKQPQDLVEETMAGRNNHKDVGRLLFNENKLDPDPK